jgi:putative hydrolase of the HAD superfamily
MRDGFAHIQSWIFDLDNTLYPFDNGLFAQIDRRMGEFIARHFGIDPLKARRIQKHYFKTYGTTLNGLMTQHGIKPEEYLDFVHDIDHSSIKPDPALSSALTALPGEKIIYTNASASHSKRVLERLGIDGLFDRIYDIAASGYEPKPCKTSYERFREQTGIAPQSSIMFEDMAGNLEVAHDMGMLTVLVKTGDSHPDSGYGLLGTGGEPYVDFSTGDLAGFLNAITQKREAYSEI